MWLEKTGRERDKQRGRGERERENVTWDFQRKRGERERVFVMGFKELLHCRNI